MDDIKERVIKCFETTFPDLPRSAITSASQGSVAAWDSLATVTLVNVLEDEFQVELDLEQLAKLDSFARVYANIQERLSGVNQRA
jgi:acyl carrier protein